MPDDVGPPNGVAATSVALSNVSGIAVDTLGNLYIAANTQNRVYKVAANGTISTVAAPNQVTVSGSFPFAWTAVSARIMWGTFLMLIVAAVVWYFLNRTAYGRHVYATGDDPEAARLAGINTDRILLSVYVLAGLISAIAGWALIGRVGAISPTAGENANLDSITAVVIGGTSLFGGRGSIVGTLVGALIVGVFRSAVSLAGLDVLWQAFAIGVLIIVAVALDQWIRRVSQ